MLKADGFRAAVIIDSGRARIASRRGNLLSFPTIVTAAQSLPLRAAVLDGEVAVVMPNGLTSFQALQNYNPSSSSSPTGRLTLFVFDLLFVDGVDLRRRPLSERKERLRELLADAPTDGAIQYVHHIIGDGPRVFEHVRALGAEGIVCKRLLSPYTGGRSRDWLKVKCARHGDFVIGGFTEPEGLRSGLGALLVGYHDAEQRLRCTRRGNVNAELAAT